MVSEVTPEEVKEKLDAAGVQILDTRPREEFEAGHIPGAFNIPLTELPTRIPEVDWSEHVVVACPIGQSSVQAARLIESYEGVDEDAEIASMAGGYEAWEYELETGSGESEEDQA